jgi:hypothetical protein
VVGRPEDFAARLAGIRSLYLPDGRVDAARMARSLAGVRERWPIPVTVELPWKPGDLLWRKLK